MIISRYTQYVYTNNYLERASRPAVNGWPRGPSGISLNADYLTKLVPLLQGLSEYQRELNVQRVVFLDRSAEVGCLHGVVNTLW